MWSEKKEIFVWKEWESVYRAEELQILPGLSLLPLSIVALDFYFWIFLGLNSCDSWFGKFNNFGSKCEPFILPVNDCGYNI